MRIEQITGNKKQYLELLLLADEQEDMIDRYLESGNMFALFDDDLKTVCVVTSTDKETCELKNNHKTMLVGTGDIPAIVSFYEKCGFEKSHYIRNFFTDHYDHPMFEDGIQLVDMVYLKKKL